ncbi:MAG: pyridoxamine 5'-phosphate oxidase family protein [Methanoregula sp.]|nr:MAG: pyridoxamine 5'-phosphate oxidase family protein [Methanoregula sp.]
MRRKEREITDKAEVESILSGALVCRIGLADGGEPYVVPVCFGYGDGTMYLHSAHEGKKIDMLKKNPRCCFEVDTCEGTIPSKRPCNWEMRYRSVIGFGNATIVEDVEEKKKGMNCILRHYSGTTYDFSDEEIKSVCVVRVDISEMTGKKFGS